MVSGTKEKDLEIAIEKALTGTWRENIENQINEPGAFYSPKHHGFLLAFSQDFDAQFAIDRRLFWQFLQNSQKEELMRFRELNPNDWQRKILERLDRQIKKLGVLHVLKKGLDIDNAHFDLLYPVPLASSGEKVRSNFALNLFSCMRQVPYSSVTGETVDMALFINGLPIITIELKNHWTGQTAHFDAQAQYKKRDTNQPLFQFGRCLAHFAMDTEEAYMTTKLAGADTFFLPFNLGNNFGKGNPPNPNGFRTAYVWEQVFTKQSLANIIQHFMRLDGSAKDPLEKRTLFFPRYHQLDVVRRLIADVGEHGVGKRYLIQHSAGSGKSNSITWLAYQLIETYPQNNTAANGRALDCPIFDSVIVVTDRRLLDKQLRDNIKDFSEVKNIIAPALSSAELRQSLEQGKKIIITTIQKFPFIVDGIADLNDRQFAVIIDEAHSSQSGSAHDNMNKVMGKMTDLDAEDVQDLILQTMQSRKMRGNASYFAFTATPKNSTLEKFGEKQADGKFKPFHLYSMKQAIEEGFILDVIANYTTYQSFYEIQKSIEDNPEFDSKNAQRRLRAFVERSKQTIETKAEVMLDHFIGQVFNRKKLKGKAKGMVVTQNIETAIRYFQALNHLLTIRGNPFKIAIAFSGSKMVDGVEYTEAEMNSFAENETKDYFNKDEYRLLVVANKYLTGFDQPKLCAMYVDKKLSGVLCVQALSRLNRSANKLGKRSEDLFVLDFFNSVDDIKKAFDPFYTSTTLSEETDVNVLHDLKTQLDETGVYEQAEVNEFTEGYFANLPSDQLSAIIDVAVQRFDSDVGLAQADKVDFKVKAKQFLKIYGQMASIINFENIGWEKLYWFLKFLVPKLKVQDPKDEFDEILNAVDLSTYGLARNRLNYRIKLDDSESELAPQNPNPRGGYTEDEEKDPIDEIIKTFNERWFQGWSATPEEQRVKFINITERIRKHKDFEQKYKNNPDIHTRGLAFEQILRDVMSERHRDELELYKLFAKDPAFKMAWTQSLQRALGG
ncbi:MULTISPECIES: type I restriction endonuclease subunit R [unclassified Pasteurella]|uniref:type I restriction endonuclease subunit R n=1 Tax=unclassified Pasteurella TaxID=2621516 RepID=UPI0010749DC1|nr:type I restriction endonuclease subunit R [Pasteurella sp. 19428wF3_WM03]TFU51959.1 type I restriction endonuclease subunit R [Pasteurella sp. WM03]